MSALLERVKGKPKTEGGGRAKGWSLFMESKLGDN